MWVIIILADYYAYHCCNWGAEASRYRRNPKLAAAAIAAPSIILASQHQHQNDTSGRAAQLGFHMNSRKLSDGDAKTSAQVSPSIVVIIIVLTIIFFLSAFLHLLIRWLARHPALIRRGLHAGVSSDNRIVTLTALQGQLQQLFSLQDAGLERALIEELPVFSYKAAMGGLKEGADCAICLCEFVADDQLRLLPSCGHAFHTDCIDTWLLAHSTCPLCRTTLLPECWLQTALLPAPSSAESAGTIVDNQSLDASAVATLSSRFAALNSSSRRSSHGRFTVMAAGVHQHPNDPGFQLPSFGNPPPTRLESVPSTESTIGSVASNSTRCVARSMSSEAEPYDETYSQNLTTVPELSNGDNHRKNHLGNDDASGPVSRCSTTLNVMDSGRLSYTSMGNQTDVFSETCTESELAASAYGSGRRISVHLGKCRIVNEKGKRRSSRSSSSRRCYSKGSFEYVIDSSSNLEVLIPPPNPSYYAKEPGFIASSRPNDALNLSRRSSELPPNTMTTGSRHVASETVGPFWASSSFRKLKSCLAADDAELNKEGIKVPLNDSLVASDQPDTSVACDKFDQSSTLVGNEMSASMQNVDKQLIVGSNVVTPGSRKRCVNDEDSKRAVSFRLSGIADTSANPNATNARLMASASRRTLSENEAFSFWEPSFTTDQLTLRDIELHGQGHVSNDDSATSIQHRSGSFAKRTMDWLVGCPRRIVHPDQGGLVDTH